MLGYINDEPGNAVLVPQDTNVPKEKKIGKKKSAKSEKDNPKPKPRATTRTRTIKAPNKLTYDHND